MRSCCNREDSDGRRTLLVVSALVFMAAPCQAIEIVCPARIFTTQILDKPEAGWQEFVRPDGEGGIAKYSYASGISIYSGAPVDIVELKPGSEVAGYPSWHFLKTSPEAPPIYMACQYFDTRIQFVKMLPPNLKRCTAKRGGSLQCELFGS